MARALKDCVAARQDVIDQLCAQLDELRERVVAREQERDASEFGRKSAVAEMDRLRERADKALVRAETAERDLERGRAAHQARVNQVSDEVNKVHLDARASLRKRLEAAESREQDLRAKYEEAERTCDDWVRKAQCERIRRESAEAKYEALLAVAKVPAGVLDYANGHRGVGASWFDAADFIRRLADATKPEPPKRKTREEIVEGVLRGVCSADLEPLAREIIAALDASEAP